MTSGSASFHDPRLGDRAGQASSTRLGDSRIAVQTQLWNGGLQLSVAVDAKLPLYSNGSLREGHGIYGDYIPAPGDGQIDVGAWILAGRSIADWPAWFELAAGWRHRTEAFIGWNPEVEVVDGVPFRGLLGGQLWQGRLLAMLNVEGIKNLSSDRVTRESLGAGPSVLWTIAHGIAVEARFAAELLARNQAQGLAFGVGISKRSE